MARKGLDGPRSTFGKLFFEHYGETCTTNRKLYDREQQYFFRNGHPSWGEDGKPLPKWVNRGRPVGAKDSYKRTRNIKEQKTMTIKDYANQLKTKFDSVSANWNKLTIEQLEQIENCLNMVVKPVVVPQPAPVKKRTRNFKGFSKKVLQQKEEYKYDVSNGYTGKYREWLKIKKAGGTIFTNKL